MADGPGTGQQVVRETPEIAGHSIASRAEARRALAAEEILGRANNSMVPTDLGDVHISTAPDGRSARIIVAKAGETVATAGTPPLAEFQVTNGRIENFKINDPAHLGIEPAKIPDTVIQAVLKSLDGPA